MAKKEREADNGISFKMVILSHFILPIVPILVLNLKHNGEKKF